MMVNCMVGSRMSGIGGLWVVVRLKVCHLGGKAGFIRLIIGAKFISKHGV